MVSFLFISSSNDRLITAFLLHSRWYRSVVQASRAPISTIFRIEYLFLFNISFFLFTYIFFFIFYLAARHS